MKAYQIKELKNFMAKLLATDAFDCFLLAEASVTTYNTFFIDGHLVKEFFTGNVNDEQNTTSKDSKEAAHKDFSDWKDMRGLIFDLIKGKRTPVGFKIILHLQPESLEAAFGNSNFLSPQKEEDNLSLSDIKAFVLNIKYDGNTLTCITGTDFHSFLLDKTPDRLWDEYIARFLTEKGIAFDVI